MTSVYAIAASGVALFLMAFGVELKFGRSEDASGPPGKFVDITNA